MPSLLEAEQYVDSVRWQKLDDLCLGHYFDLDALIVYALKLLILLRWEAVSKVDSRELLEKTLATA
jgi:hypothetical protein